MRRSARSFRRFPAPRRGRRTHRRGIALVDVIIGSVLLGMGLTVVMTITSRALNNQIGGEQRLVASWLADELLAMVLVEGPTEYRQGYDLAGRFRPPFEQFSFDLAIKDNGPRQPVSVAATVFWQHGKHARNVSVETLIAERQYREDEEDLGRAPREEVDRESRYFDDEF
jgi:hypothetical protein